MLFRKGFVCLVGFLCLSGCQTMDGDEWVGSACKPPPPPPRERIVFVTSTSIPCEDFLYDRKYYQGLCALSAFNAGLPGEYHAWVSDDLGGPASLPPSVFKKDGKFINTNGDVVANSWADLTDGTLQNPIVYDEYGNYTPSAWPLTGTNSAGNTDQNCDDFSDWFDCQTGSVTVTIGCSHCTDASWTDQAEIPCSTMGNRRVYCFQR
jgi:hypothetical protein